MVTIFFRTILIYLLLIGAMRLMGKRQIGELEISELVTTLLLSEIATLPIENTEIPLVFAVIPILTLLIIEIFFSQALLAFPRLRRLLTAQPTVLIKNGEPDLKALRHVRITLEELLSQLREKDVSDISEVAYAILEQTGRISVLKKKLNSPPDAALLDLTPPEPGITHILVADGKLRKDIVEKLKTDQRAIEKLLSRYHATIEETALLLIDDLGNTRFFRRKKEDI